MIRATSLVLVLLIASSAEAAQTASWYSYASCKREGTSGLWTASRERFDENALTCASPHYPFGTILSVTNLKNKKTVRVRVNDRGPNASLFNKGRVIDLSKGAFRTIAPLSEGVVPVSIEVLR
jgi:rare lipoprotein A